MFVILCGRYLAGTTYIPHLLYFIDGLYRYLYFDVEIFLVVNYDSFFIKLMELFAFIFLKHLSRKFVNIYVAFIKSHQIG